MQWIIFAGKKGLDIPGVVNLRIKTGTLLFITALSICLFISSCSIKTGIDLIGKKKSELEQILAKESDSPLKVDILNELAYRESWDGTNKSLYRVMEAKNLAEKINYNVGHVDALFILSQFYFLKGDFENFKTNRKEGIKLAENINYNTGRAMAYIGIARYQQQKGEYDKALKNFLKAEAICKNSRAKKDKRALATAIYGLGALYYYNTEDYREALNCFDKYRELGKDINDNIIITSGFYTVGEQYRGLGKYQEAKKNFTDCLNQSIEIGLKYNQANAYEGLGDMYLDMKDYNKAEESFNISYNLFNETRNKFQVAEILKRLGKLYNRKREYEKAIRYLNEVFKYANDLRIPKTATGACEEMIISQETLGNNKLSSDYYKILLYGREFFRKKEMLNQKLLSDFEQASENEKIKRNFLTVGIIVLFILSIVLVILLLIVINQKKQLEKSSSTIAQMSEIAKVIISSLSVYEIVERVYKNVNRLMDAEGFYIGIYNEKEQRLELSGGKEYGEKMPEYANYLSEKNRLSVHCFNHEVEIRIGDYENEYKKYVPEKPPLKIGRSFNSHIFLPLILIDSQGVKKKLEL